MKKRLLTNQHGFTAPELLVALAVFLGIGIGSYYLLKPKSFGAQERDAKRMVGTSQIMRGIVKYYEDNGHLPAAIADKNKVIGSDKDSANLCANLVPKYMHDLPLDPTWGLETVNGNCAAKDQQYITSYLVSTTDNGKTLLVSAPMAEKTSIHLRRSLP